LPVAITETQNPSWRQSGRGQLEIPRSKSVAGPTRLRDTPAPVGEGVIKAAGSSPVLLLERAKFVLRIKRDGDRNRALVTKP